jgi:hypothetical protein
MSNEFDSCSRFMSASMAGVQNSRCVKQGKLCGGRNESAAAIETQRLAEAGASCQPLLIDNHPLA